MRGGVLRLVWRAVDMSRTIPKPVRSTLRMTGVGLFWVVIATAACNRMSNLMPNCTPEGEPLVLTGRVEVEKPDPRSEGKTFLGVTFVSEKSEKWVLTYSSD